MYQFIKKYYLLVMLALSWLIPGTDLYSQWTQQASGTNYDLYSVYFLNNNTGFIGSNSWDIPNFIGGEIIRTTNAGENWIRVLLDSNIRVKDFYFIDQFTGFAVGGIYTITGRMYKSTNSGLNWFNITDPTINSHILNLQFVNSSTAFAGGTYGVFKSTNAGINWSQLLNINFSMGWGKVLFFDQNTGIYTGDTSKVYKTTDSGSNWTTINTPSNTVMRDITQIDDNTCIIVGDSLILRSSNRGNSWTRINNPQNTVFYSVQFLNSTTGYLTGYYNSWKTTNSGFNWFSVHSNPLRKYLSTNFIDINTGYIVGDSGSVYKTTTGGVIGINNISGEVPKEYSLNQNYPNPFNPSTNIRFSIPKSAFVRLAVYDLLGREVESLVNQQLTPGTYEVSWNALKFSSGIYMYRLVTNDFQMVKKMSLIK